MYVIILGTILPSGHDCSTQAECKASLDPHDSTPTINESRDGKEVVA